MTNESIWSEIYIDAGIEKHVFLPEMLNEWEKYWTTEYQKVKETVGKTAHLDEMKEKSWRQFQVYMECYDDIGDIIDLACKIDNVALTPLQLSQ
ncbi:hypothetical protein QW060_22160 [Myroides ceti]|uniref:Uncharacterized protein n=1 Tax=Paenimyroides ceti TaxID=395087 RepID=A0ABT8CZJ7_9FLAO|nr:hypothetical protein [Paenimyroides ceti]MDN3709665.1 hypothetical protein [Paenimyroides ceti]